MFFYILHNSDAGRCFVSGLYICYPHDICCVLLWFLGRALVRSMGEILFLCGNNRRAVIATLSILGNGIQKSEETSEDEVTSIFC